jgi:uncharacterized lipoprotein YmbA
MRRGIGCVVSLLTFWMAPLWLCSGCARSPEPALYALSARQGRARQSPVLRLQLRRPELPMYLDRPQILRRGAGQRLELAPRARWAAPLASMLAATLAEDVEMRLPNALVYEEGGGISASADVLVQVELRHFERASSGPLRVSGLLNVTWVEASGLLHSNLSQLELRTNPSGSSTSDLVSGLSDLVGLLADEIAASVSRGPNVPH